MKASNFTGSSLRVGTWKKDSVYEGDLVAKFYYAKRKLVWEVLHAGVVRKMEVGFEDVVEAGEARDAAVDRVVALGLALGAPIPPKAAMRPRALARARRSIK